MDRTRTSNRPIGSPVERLEDLRFLRGRGEYVDDLPSLGALHAVILRSAVAHGRIRSIDVSAALKRPGVRTIITAKDILGEGPGDIDRKSTRLNSSHIQKSRMPSSA